MRVPIFGHYDSVTMIFSLVILGSPYSNEASDTAYRFVAASLDAGHQVYRIFFYHDGVQCANQLSSPPQDEVDISARWQDIAERHNIDLVVCIAAALKRGVLDQKEAKRYNKEHFNLEAPYDLSGLGQLVDATINSDRVITFAA